MTKLVDTARRSRRQLFPLVLAAFTVALAVFVGFTSLAAGALSTNTVAAGAWTIAVDGATDSISITCTGGNVAEVTVAGTPTNAEGDAACSSITSIAITGGTGANIIDLTGIDTVTANKFTSLTATTINGNGGGDTIDGSPIADTITGTADVDDIDGRLGNDTITGGGGADVLEGGTAGTDTIKESSTTLTLTNTALTVGATADTTFGGFEAADLDGTAGADTVTLTGWSGTSDIDTLGDVDTIVGGSGVDDIDAGLGSDTVTGGDGADVLAGGTGDTDTIKESSTAIALQNTSLSVGGVADTSFGGFEDADLDGTSGVDTITLTGWTSTSDIDSLGGADVVTGGSGADNIDGGADADNLNGAGGDDIFNEGAAANGGDTFTGGAGTADLVDYSGRSAAVTVTIGAGANDGASGELDDVQSTVENVTGGSGGDNLTDDAGSNTLNGGGGDDSITGGLGGTDTFSGGAHTGGDTISLLGSGVGADSITTTATTVALSGGGTTTHSGFETHTIDTQAGGDDTLTLNGTSTTINTNNGNDTITINSAGTGLIVNGGDGSDTFSITNFSALGNATTLNGNADSDTITLATCSGLSNPTGTTISDGTRTVTHGTVETFPDCGAVIDISVTKSASASSVTVGTNVTYTIVASNVGAQANAVTVTDVLPSTLTFVSASPTVGSCSGASTVTCSLGNLAGGSSATITLVAKPNAAGSIGNTATIAATGTEFDTADNTSATATITATSSVTSPPPSGGGGGSAAVVSVSGGVSPGTVAFGGNAAFTYTIKNSGTEAATGVSLSNVLPIGAAFVSSSSSQGSCSGTSCTLGTIAAGASATVTIVVQVSVFGSLTNTVTVTSGNGGNSSASATVVVGGLPALLSSSPADGSVVASVDGIELRASTSVEWSALSVERPDGSRTGLAGGSGSSISRAFSSSVPGAYTVRATMTAGGSTVNAVVHFTVYAGSGIVPAVQETVSVNEPGTLAAPGGKTSVSWPAAAIVEPIVLTLESAPTKATTFGAGNQVVSLSAQRADGSAVTTFPAPFDIEFANVPADFVPAVSQDGVNFRALAQLASHTLPAGQLDGYYREGASVHILTRHFTYFAVLNRANFKLSVRIAGTPRVNTSRTRTVGVLVSMSLASPARVTLLDAGDRAVATSARQLKKGATVVTLALPKAVEPGRYTLVVAAGAKRDVVARQSVVVSAGETKAAGRTRVLLAGYDAIRKDLAAALAPLYPVASSSPSQAAYRLASLTGGYRLVIVEYSAGGTQLIRDLRTLFPDVKIVVVTESPTQARLARAAGADATIRKPATGLAVAKTVLRLLFPTVS